MEKRPDQIGAICACTFGPPKVWQLTSVPFLADLARYHSRGDFAASQRLYRVLDEFFEHHTGKLFDMTGKPIDFDREAADGEDLIEWSFGRDWPRGMRRLLERGAHPFTNRMKGSEKLVMRVLLLHYAREIQLCRSVGRCSGN